MVLETERLRLVPFAPEHLLALIEQPERFQESFGFPAADGLRDLFASGEISPAWLDSLRRAPGADPWTLGFGLVHRRSGQVVGSASFKGPPDQDGTVEIAYGIAPGFQGNGYATEAATALVSFALADGRVQRVRAHTLAEPNASTGVLRKCGFRLLGEVDDPEDGVVWRWQRERMPA